jgi:hypothetical protein
VGLRPWVAAGGFGEGAVRAARLAVALTQPLSLLLAREDSAAIEGEACATGVARDSAREVLAGTPFTPLAAAELMQPLNSQEHGV